MDRVVHFEIPALDIAVAAAKRFCGEVLGWGLTDIPGMGYYADARDPDGNVFGLWEAMVAS
jgi:predicted enzyme related to lactoylglutathione lyase